MSRAQGPYPCGRPQSHLFGRLAEAGRSPRPPGCLAPSARIHTERRMGRDLTPWCLPYASRHRWPRTSGCSSSARYRASRPPSTPSSTSQPARSSAIRVCGWLRIGARCARCRRPLGSEQCVRQSNSRSLACESVSPGCRVVSGCLSGFFIFRIFLPPNTTLLCRAVLACLRFWPELAV